MIKEETFYYEDKNGNKFDSSKYTLEEAEYGFKTLINCFNCINTIWSMNCDNLINCYDMYKCKSCTNCEDCCDCTLLSGEVGKRGINNATMNGEN